LIAKGTHRFPSWGWTALLLAAGLALLAGAAFHARQHFHSPPPAPSHRTSASDLNRVATWMTLRYVSRMYDVPEPVLLRAVQVGPLQARRRTLAGIASLRGVETRTVLTEVRAAIRQYRQSNPARPTPTARPAP
jgi:hypothetical protein